MNENISISVIVPVYNVQKYLSRCIVSVVEQTLDNIEIILVDDGSSDECPKICDEWEKKDSRIKVIHKENAGLGYARNTGMKSARGEYICFVDSDDYIPINALEKLYESAREYRLDICFGANILEDKSGNKKKRSCFFSGRILQQPDITKKVLAGMLGLLPKCNESEAIDMSVWQGIYRRDFLEEYGLKFPSEREFISEDIIFHIDCLPKAKKMMFIPEPTYIHMIDNENSLTNEYNEKRFEKVVVLYKEELRRLELLEMYHEMKLRVQELFLGNVRVCIKQIVAQKQLKGKNYVNNQLSQIIKNETVQDVLKEYPYWKNPFRRAIMSFLIKYRMKTMIILLTNMFIK